jgi:tetratricopeptide (TPR) repeat protein
MGSRFLVSTLCIVLAALTPFRLRGQNSLPADPAQQARVGELQLAQPSMQNDGTAWWRVGMMEQDAARYGDAERCYLRAISLLERGDSLTLANALDSAGTMYVELGDYTRAEPLEQRALSIRQGHNDSIGEGRSWMHLAVLSLGRHDKAAALRDALLAKGRLVDARPEAGAAATPEEKMTALTDLALALCANGRCAQAISPLKRARQIAAGDTASAGKLPAGTIDFVLGYTYWKVGHIEEAGRLMKSGIAGMEITLGFGHPTYIQALSSYHTFLEQTGDFTGALAVRDRLNRLESPVEAAATLPTPGSR